MKTINFLKSGICFKDYKESVPDELDGLKDKNFKNYINKLKNLLLLSLYFSQYKYLVNLLSYEEIINIYKNRNKIENIAEIGEKAFSLIEKLVEKILAKESILELKKELIEIQRYYIMFIFLIIFTKIKENKKEDFIKFYQISNFLRDFGFCSKIYIFYTFLVIHFINNKFFEDIYIPATADVRMPTFFHYSEENEENKIELSEKNIKIIKMMLYV